MKIETEDLLKIIDLLKNNISESFPDGIEVEEEDFYWDISEDELYDPTKDPGELTLGQLSDDWSELLRLKSDDGIPISYDLKRLAVILQIVRKQSVGLWQLLKLQPRVKTRGFLLINHINGVRPTIRGTLIAMVVK